MSIKTNTNDTSAGEFTQPVITQQDVAEAAVYASLSSIVSSEFAEKVGLGEITPTELRDSHGGLISLLSTVLSVDDSYAQTGGIRRRLQKTGVRDGTGASHNVKPLSRTRSGSDTGHHGSERTEAVVTRRDVLEATLTAVFAAATTSQAGGAAPDEGSECDSQGNDSSTAPKWTAHAVSEHGYAETEKSDKIYKIVSQSRLEYLGARYERYGNPQSPDSESRSEGETGAWRHTFVLSTHGLGLRPWPTLSSIERDREYDWFENPHNPDIPPETFFAPILAHRGVKEYDYEEQRDAFARVLNLTFPNRFEQRPNPIDGGLAVTPSVEVSTVYPEDVMAISARRDLNLFAFSDASNFLSSFRHFPGIRLLQSYAEGLAGDGINRNSVTSAPFDRIEALKQTKDSIEDQDAFIGAIKSGVGFGVSTVGLLSTAKVISLALSTSIALSTFGVALAALGLILAIVAFLKERNDQPEGVDYFEGFARVHPRSNDPSQSNGPAAGASVLFDIYVSPNNNATATVRARENSRIGYGNNPSYVGSITDRHIWFVNLPSLPVPENPDNPELPPSEIHDASLITPDSPNWPDEEYIDTHQQAASDEDIEEGPPPVNDDHNIKIQSEDVESSLVERGPNASFSLDWCGKKSLNQVLAEKVGVSEFLNAEDRILDPDQTYVTTDNPRQLVDFEEAVAEYDQTPMLSDGSIVVTFDASSTLLGGSQIKRYRWDLFRLGPCISNEEEGAIRAGCGVPSDLRDDLRDALLGEDVAVALKKLVQGAHSVSRVNPDPTLDQAESKLNTINEGPLFKSEDSARVKHKFVQSGLHVMILTVEDAQGNRGQHVAEFNVVGSGSETGFGGQN